MEFEFGFFFLKKLAEIMQMTGRRTKYVLGFEWWYLTRANGGDILLETLVQKQ